MTNWVFVSTAVFLTLFYAWITYTEGEWRIPAWITAAMAIMAVGGIVDHTPTVTFGLGLMVSAMFVNMVIGTPPHRQHVKQYAERYGEN